METTPTELTPAGDVVISVRDVGKQYQLFSDPRDRLKHMLLWRFGKTYGHPFWALRHVSFDLRRGEMLAIIGKNGSGKSTLLQLLAGILTPSEGSIQVKGRVGALLELGSGFNPDYTGRENIQLNASILGISEEELKGKIQAIIDFADIGEFIDQPVKLYSSGMFVRLAFAVTTGLKSDVLLIDEALAVGDVFFRQKCYQRLEEMRREGVSIILVTHAMGDVTQYCERAILLDKGQPAFTGTAIDAVRQYFLVMQNIKEVEYKARQTQSEEQDPTRQAGMEGSLEWPGREAFFDISQLEPVGNGWARCTGVAMCDPAGKACRVFHQGERAVFFYEFEISRNIGVPYTGITIFNDKNIVVHGKSALQVDDLSLPSRANQGDRIRVRHELALELEIGEYTFGIGSGTLEKEIYDHRAIYPNAELDAHCIRMCSLYPIGPFTITARTKPARSAQLLHHGIANLPGKMSVSVLD